MPKRTIDDETEGKMSYQEARDIVEKALEEEKKNNYTEALELYKQGIEHFLQVLKYENHGEKKESIKKECSNYLDKADKLKRHIAVEAAAGNEGCDLNSKKTDSDSSESNDENVCEFSDENHGEKKESIKKECSNYLDKADKLKRHIAVEAAAGNEGCDLNSKKTDSDSSESNDENVCEFSDIIVRSCATVKWGDVAGLTKAKQAVKETVILPFKFPLLFKGTRKPYRGILLYGPAGTGKTLLAKAVLTEVENLSFFSISFADVVTKWLGEGEKLMKALFRLARKNKPSIIFVDEIEAICTAHRETECDSLRRTTTEFLIQMSGCDADNDGVTVFAATNMPWAIGPAIRKRFEKRIYIPLPEAAARADMFKMYLEKERKHSLNEHDFELLGKKTEGYSGADISIVVREAVLQPVRKAQKATHFKRVSVPSKDDADVMIHDFLTPCSPEDPGAIEINVREVPGDKLFEPVVNMDDMLMSLSMVKATVNEEDLKKLQEFTKDFGQQD